MDSVSMAKVCRFCQGSGLAVPSLDDCCLLCQGWGREEKDEDVVARVLEFELAGRAETRDGMDANAEQTLRVHEQGGYWHEGGIVSLAPLLRRAVAGTVLCAASDARAATRARSQGHSEARIEVTLETTLAAGSRLHAELGPEAGGALGLLNFASAKNPGGGFRKGALAQEESLALASGLYACLAPHEEFYQPHRSDPADGLYSHAMLYSPRVPFFREDDGGFCAAWCAGVVTSPAPNAGVAREKSVSDAAIFAALRERIGRILAVAQEQGHTHLVLGAFGCGVFKNDPLHVALAFDSWLRGSGAFVRSFQKVVFAIPRDSHNYPAFTEVFGGGQMEPRAMERLVKRGGEEQEEGKGRGVSKAGGKSKQGGECGEQKTGRSKKSGR